MDPTDLMAARWNRLFAGVAGGALFGILAGFIAAAVRLEGTGAAKLWFVVASFGFGFALGVPAGVAVCAHFANRPGPTLLPRARLLRRGQLRLP